MLGARRLLKDTGNLKIPGAIFDYRSKWLLNIMKPSSRHVYAVFKMANCMPRRKVLRLVWIKGHRFHVNIAKEILILKLRYALSLISKIISPNTR